MAVDTHCLTSGALGTDEIPVSNTNASTWTVSDPGAGNRRGIFVFIHGLGGGYQNIPPIPSNSGGSGTYVRIGDLSTALVNDGWIFVYPSCHEDYCTSLTYYGEQGIYNDCNNDTGNGSRFQASTLHWWDHIVDTINTTYGSGKPIIVGGGSFGAFKTLLIAANRSSSVIGYMSALPACLPGNISPAYTLGNSYGTISWTGLQLSSTYLNAVTLPGLIGYGTADQVVGWAASTWNGTNGQNVSGLTTLSVASNTNFVNGANIMVATNSGFATFSWGGTTGSGTLTGCTLLSGSGTIATGALVAQNLTDLIITNAQGASQPVIRYKTANDHEFTGTPSAVTTTANSGSYGTALSAASTIDVASSTSFLTTYTTAVTGLSGGTGSALINFTGTGSGTPNTLTGCTVLCGSGTIQAGTTFTQVNDAICETAWVQAVLDPNHPVTF